MLSSCTGWKVWMAQSLENIRKVTVEMWYNRSWILTEFDFWTESATVPLACCGVMFLNHTM